MRVTIDWLREHVDLDEGPEEVARLLTDSGTNVEEVRRVGEDDVLDLEITTNRPDCLGVLGVARELAAVLGRPLRRPSLEPVEAGPPASELCAVEVEDPALCPRYTARVVRGVAVGPSPAWLRRRLEAVGIRSVSNVVDVSNYVMLEWSQPLHFFDLARIRGAAILVRRARPGERMTAIDGREYPLDPDRLVIADRGGAIAIAGVMGGIASEVSAGTTDVLIESARFDARSVRSTSRVLGLASESSYRFERFVDQELVERASLRAALLLREVAGGEIAPGVVDVAAAPPAREPVRLRWARVPRLLGIDVPRERCRTFLAALGLETLAEDADSIVLRPPSWRPDLTREADLIEEIARLHGFDAIPVETRLTVRAPAREPLDRVVETVRSFLVGAGIHEVVTLSLVGTGVAEDPPVWTAREALAVRNPVRAGEDRLRRSLLGSLLSIADRNRDLGREGIRLFEIAHVYLPGEDDRPAERTVASILVEDDLAGIVGLVETLTAAIGEIARLRREPESAGGFFRTGRGAAVRRGEPVVAVLGEIEPSLSRHEGARLAAAEIDLEAFVGEADGSRVRTVRPSRFPEVRRDLSVVIDEEVTWERLGAAIDGTATPDLREIRFFDLYRGEQAGEGRKSIAFTLIFRSDERTLTGEEVDARVATIVDALGRETGATLRA